MRTLNNLAVPQSTDSNFPFGGIINETDTDQGTPVVEEIYGDVLSNIYKVLQLAGVVPTQSQDKDNTQYQFVEALRKLPNLLNDVEQVLSLSGTVWSIPFKLENLPNKYVCFARASENYNSSLTYTFKGTGATEYSLISTDGFKSSDELLVIIDNSEVRVYSINSSRGGAANEMIATVQGNPLSFNNSGTLYYFDNGRLYSDIPSVNNIENVLKTFAGDTSLLILNVFNVKNKFLCFTVNDDLMYRFYQFDNDNLSTPVLVSYVISNATNHAPNCYVDSRYVYLTNDANTSANDYVLKKINYNADTHTMTDNSSIALENTFVKNTNVVMVSNALITLVSGELNSFSFVDDTKTLLGMYNIVLGTIFHFKNDIWFGNGNVATKWNI